MKKKVIHYLVFGFLEGAVVGNLIAFLTSLGSGHMGVVTPTLAARVTLGGAIVLQSLLTGVLGVAAVGGMLYYEIERWSLAKATVVHFAGIVVAYVGAALALDWLPLTVAAYAISIAVMAFAFGVIWLVMYLRWRAQVHKMNEELKEYIKEEQI